MNSKVLVENYVLVLLHQLFSNHCFQIIFFAGEATTSAYATVHGADRSGRRAVTDLMISPALD